MRFFSRQPILLDREPRMVDGIYIATLQELLESSKAATAFKDAVHALVEGRSTDRIQYPPTSPPIKVLRVIMKILETIPDHPIERIRIDAVSTCATYEGRTVVEPGGLEYQFVWDCAWRAKKNKVKNIWGLTDQAEAAKRFGYQCFRRFAAIKPEGG